MPQNRNKLIELFIGNISNAVVHEILAKAIDDENIRSHYNKELKVSFDIAKRYRKNINPINTELLEKDRDYIREKTFRKVKAELILRISKGYKNINLKLIDDVLDKRLNEMNV